MDKLTLAVVSRNYFNMPAWIALHAGLFRQEGLEVSIDHIEGIEEVNDRLREGRAQLAYGVTEHVILDAESGGGQVIIGGNVNKLPFTLVARPGIRGFEDLRGKRKQLVQKAATPPAVLPDAFALHPAVVLAVADDVDLFDVVHADVGGEHRPVGVP